MSDTPTWLRDLRSEDPRRHSDYQRFLQGTTWAAIRERVQRRSQGICERCNSREAAHVHHIDYSRGWSVGARRRNDGSIDLSGVDWDWLMHLCEACHRYLHGYDDIDPAAPRGWITYTDARIKRLK